ncbi:Glucose dehydrogenase [FAD, quinone] [Amphibalanus amphitrite]|uniref:Glucose dehydrogenase [FAD, quinone] n=1 Tax=Amphibalanus amphitrite TaxID=1232801 RepID=A0A6A4VIC9_AMPAM|nr:glucose dehydrogenase [FAD, quinone]-like [Amphibalanus amphitrite]KAF0293333.1 Glucose dehydrogenase [FAD, quinone] [Amphibalanus amphitrite]
MGVKVLELISRLRILGVSLTTLALIAPLDNPHKIVYDKPIRQEYDFIVVGAGSAGAVMASRLSEDPHHSVLLLEAGEDGTVFTEVPLLTALVYGTEGYDWGFRATPDHRSCQGFKGGVCVLPRGKMLGGSSAVNGLMYIRGNRQDYDQWERLGNPGWGYEDVLPYFLKAEDNQDPRLRNSPFHAVGGPLAVSPPQYISDLGRIWLKAGLSLGYPVGDVNGALQTRFMHHQTTSKNGERWSTARGYLRGASQRHNLDILVRAPATRVIVDQVTRRAKGVVFFKGGKRYVVWARKEVILSAGAFKTPQLLKLSGVGPCHELKKFKIPCIHDLPGVGENMQSHFGVGGAEYLTNKGRGLTLLQLINPVNIFNYLFKRKGPLATNLGIEGTAFLSSPLNNVSYGVDWPDVQLLFYPLQLASDGGIIFRDFLSLSNKLWSQFSPNKFRSGFRIVPINLRPRSRGRVLLRSRNPFQDPAIQLRLFDDPWDVAVLREAGLMAEKVALSAPFRHVGARPSLVPSKFCGALGARSGPWWECQARVFSETIYHDTSTCAMGPAYDPWSVVDNQLRVYGVSGLRVVDASVMPRIISGNTNAPTIMIAEKAADLVRARWRAIALGLEPEQFVEQHVLYPHRRSGQLYDPTGPVVQFIDVLKRAGGDGGVEAEAESAVPEGVKLFGDWNGTAESSSAVTEGGQLGAPQGRSLFSGAGAAESGAELSGELQGESCAEWAGAWSDEGDALGCGFQPTQKARVDMVTVARRKLTRLLHAMQKSESLL